MMHGPANIKLRKHSSTSNSTSTLGANSPVGSEVPFGGLAVWSWGSSLRYTSARRL